ncbi:DNA-cytosine methyltransferase [Clostridioides difficile]|nr:DNA-cytosine methyltransferase [Clostridioides difficile]
MDKYMFPISQVASMSNMTEENLRKSVEVICVDGCDYVNIEQLNKLIVEKQIKYKFSDINVRNKNPEFCSKRDIKKNGLNVIDLFCGAGGSSAGFRLAGFNLVGALDVNKAAAKTHELNFPDCKTVVGDITKLTPNEFDEIIEHKRVDIVIGSPPCQTFSSLSQGKIRSLGKDIKHDIRNYFYKNYLDYVTYFKPKVFLMENVPGFMTKYKGEIFQDLLQYIKENLPEYDVKYSIVEAKEYSVPQARKRLFVCGYKKQYNFDFPVDNREFCDGKQYVTVREAIEDLPLIQDDWRLDKVPYSSSPTNPFQQIMRGGQLDAVTNNICRVSNQQAKELFVKLKPGERYTDLTKEMQEEISLFDTFDSSVIKGRCRKLPMDDIAWTVIAHIGMDGYEYIHPSEVRTLSVREAARLQSFPDDFVFVGNMREQYVQIGNAVPPLMSYAIAKRIGEVVIDDK